MFREIRGNSEMLETRSGGGVLMLVALPVLGIAVLSCFGLLAGRMPTTRATAPWPVMLLFGVVFGVAGVLLCFYRRGIVLDRRRRTTAVWWGLLTPMRETVRPWSEFTTVTITAEVRRSKNSTYTVYPVCVTGQGKPLTLTQPQQYPPARQTAEQVAEFMGLPLHDSSSGINVVREPGELNEPLAQRLRRTGTVVSLPPPPTAMQAKLFRKDKSFMFELPTPLNLPMLVSLAAGAVFTVFVVFSLGVRLLPDFGLPRPVVAVLAVMVLVAPELFLGLHLFLGRRQPVRVIVSPTGLRVETRAVWRAKIEEIPAEKIEELEVLPTGPLPLDIPQLSPQVRRVLEGVRARVARGIMARSDTQTIEFGQMLSEEEKQYLAAVIRYVLLS